MSIPTTSIIQPSTNNHHSIKSQIQTKKINLQWPTSIVSGLGPFSNKYLLAFKLSWNKCIWRKFRKYKWKWSRLVVSTLCDLWTVAHQAPPSMGFSRQEYWSGLPFPSLGDLPDPGIESRSPTLQVDALTSAPPGKPRESIKKDKEKKLLTILPLRDTIKTIS